MTTTVTVKAPSDKSVSVETHTHTTVGRENYSSYSSETVIHKVPAGTEATFHIYNNKQMTIEEIDND